MRITMVAFCTSARAERMPRILPRGGRGADRPAHRASALLRTGAGGRDMGPAAASGRPPRAADRGDGRPGATDAGLAGMRVASLAGHCEVPVPVAHLGRRHVGGLRARRRRPDPHPTPERDPVRAGGPPRDHETGRAETVCAEHPTDVHRARRPGRLYWPLRVKVAQSTIAAPAACRRRGSGSRSQASPRPGRLRKNDSSGMRPGP
jgi:hypothetical protein